MATDVEGRKAELAAEVLRRMQAIHGLIVQGTLQVPENTDHQWETMMETMRAQGAALSADDAQILMNMAGRLIEKGALGDPDASQQLPADMPEAQRGFAGPKTTLSHAVQAARTL